jgi:hypothetical protein
MFRKENKLFVKASLSLLILLAAACQQEETPLPLKVDLAPPAPMPIDAAIPEIPVEIADIFENLPIPPSPIVRTPGNAVATLKQERPNLMPALSEDVLIEHLDGGAFKSIAYLLDSKREKIRAVSATFNDSYLHDVHRDRLKVNISMRLGTSTPVDEANYSGEKWTTVDYRVELRRDKKSKELEILFHQYGAETLERTRKGIKVTKEDQP